MMLTGFIPNAETVDTVGAIARDLKLGAATKPGSFFWGESIVCSWNIGEASDEYSTRPCDGRSRKIVCR
jgi:hypothetical protein